MPDPKDLSFHETALPDADSAPDAIPSGDGQVIGTKIGAYRITALLGSGAMGDVYRAEHVDLGRPVAIKALKAQLAANESLVGRFFAEARAVNLIRHENIVECTDLIRTDEGRSYIVMELLEGNTLGELLESQPRLDWQRAIAIAAQVADAIDAAHQRKIVHRDLKPDNIFLIERRETRDYVKVLDFGIAHLHPSVGGLAATQTGEMLGTPAYMSPEQCKGDPATPAADIYCLGVILFQMLAGRWPFEAANAVEIMSAHIGEAPARVAAFVDVPPGLDALINAMLEKEPSARPPSMSEVASALRAIEAEHTGVEGPADERRTSATRPWQWVLVGAIAAVGVVTALALRSPPALPAAAVDDSGPASLTDYSGLDDALARALMPPAPEGCRPDSETELRRVEAAVRALEDGPNFPDDSSEHPELIELKKSPPASPEGLAILAWVHLIDRETEAAIDRASEAVERCPKLFAGHSRLAVAYLAGDDLARAARHGERALAIAPEHLGARFELGLIRAGEKRFEEALDLFHEIEERDSTYPNLQLARGEALLQLGDDEQAKIALHSALENGDDPARAHFALGYALRDLGDPDAAAAAFCAAQRAGHPRAASMCSKLVDE